MVQTQKVVGERRVRRCRSVSEKRQIVQLMLELGASVSEVPRAHGVTANEMFAWWRPFEGGRLTQPCSALLPASASFVRDGGFTAKWTGFVNTRRPIGTNPASALWMLRCHRRYVSARELDQISK